MALPAASSGIGGRWAGAALPVCLALGLVLRLAAAALPQLTPSICISDQPLGRWAEIPFFPDSVEYTRMAYNVRAGLGLCLDEASRIARMPAYPLFLAGVQAVFGERLLVARVADALLGTGLIALVFLLARELYGRREALLAAAITAVYPFFVAQALLVLSETLFAVFLVLGIWLLARAWRTSGPIWAALAGLAFGLATLTRGSFLAVPFLFAAAWTAFRALERRVVLGALAMIGAFALALTPWVIRNRSASGGHLVPTTLRVGPSLYEGLNPRANGGPMMDDLRYELDGPAVRGLSEWERDRHWREAALRWAAENPGRAFALAGIKFVRFWNVVPNLEQLRGTTPCVAFGVPYALVMLLAAVGLAKSRRAMEVIIPILLPVAYYCLVHMVFIGSVRYREVLMPLLIVVGAHGALALWTWARGGKPVEEARACDAAQGKSERRGESEDVGGEIGGASGPLEPGT